MYIKVLSQYVVNDPSLLITMHVPFLLQHIPPPPPHIYRFFFGVMPMFLHLFDVSWHFLYILLGSRTDRSFLLSVFLLATNLEIGELKLLYQCVKA